MRSRVMAPGSFDGLIEHAALRLILQIAQARPRCRPPSTRHPMLVVPDDLVCAARTRSAEPCAMQRDLVEKSVRPSAPPRGADRAARARVASEEPGSRPRYFVSPGELCKCPGELFCACSNVRRQVKSPRVALNLHIYHSDGGFSMRRRGESNPSELVPAARGRAVGRALLKAPPTQITPQLTIDLTIVVTIAEISSESDREAITWLTSGKPPRPASVLRVRGCCHGGSTAIRSSPGWPRGRGRLPRVFRGETSPISRAT